MSNGETVMLDIKYVMFLAMQVLVFAAFGAALIAGLHKIVQDKVRESRRHDQLVQDTHPTSSASHTV